MSVGYTSLVTCPQPNSLPSFSPPLTQSAIPPASMPACLRSSSLVAHREADDATATFTTNYVIVPAFLQAQFGFPDEYQWLCGYIVWTCFCSCVDHPNSSLCVIPLDFAWLLHFTRKGLPPALAWWWAGASPEHAGMVTEGLPMQMKLIGLISDRLWCFLLGFILHTVKVEGVQVLWQGRKEGGLLRCFQMFSMLISF